MGADEAEAEDGLEDMDVSAATDMTSFNDKVHSGGGLACGGIVYLAFVLAEL